MKSTLTHRFAVSSILFLLLLSTASTFAQSATGWTGNMTCQLDDEEQGVYQRQEIQTWTLTGGPPDPSQAMPVYPATWTAQAQGQLLRPQGTQTTSIQWMANVPAPGTQQPTVGIAITIRASDGRLMIKQWTVSQSAANAITGRRQVYVNGVAQGQPFTFNRALSQWAFPLIEASPGDNIVSGSTQIQADAGSAELVHRYGSAAPLATCQWRFTKAGSGTQNSGPGGMMGNGAPNQNPQNSSGNPGAQNNNSSPQNSQGGSGPASNPNCDSPSAVQQSFEAMKANIKSSYDALIQGTTDQAQIASLSQQEQRTLAGLTSQEQHDMQKAAADGCTGAGHSGSTQTQSNPPAGSNPPTGGGQNQTNSSSNSTTNTTTPAITSITPSQVDCGRMAAFQVNGQNTHFVQGMTTVDFGLGFQQTSLSVGGPASLSAHEYIHAVVTPGVHTVTITTGSEVVTTSFTVNSACNPIPLQANLYLSQNAGAQGTQNLMVQLSGQAAQRAYFVQGVTRADFGPGITTNLTVNSPTSATAVLGIDPSATTGPRDVSLNTAGELVTASQGFTVTLAQGSSPLVNLTTSYVGNGSGQVTVVPAGVSCGANCMQYPSGTNLTLTATPNSGSKFMAFGGGVCATTNPCSFAITTSTAVTGIFHLGDSSAPSGTVNLTASSGGTGSGSVAMTPVGTACGANCMQYSPGTAVTVIAVPNSGSTFANFSGGNCASSNPCSFTITASTTVTATFSLNSSSTGSTGSSGSNGIPVAVGSTHVASMGLLTGVSPATNSGQQNVTVTLTGQLTNFIDGKTAVNFVRASQPGPSVSANAAVLKNLAPSGPPPVQVGTVKVNSKTNATVTLSMNPSTAAGTYSITATTPTSSGTPEVVTLNNGFTVTPTLNLTATTLTPTPATLNVTPTSGSYLVTVTSLRCGRPTLDDPLQLDGKGDEIYASAFVRHYDRRNSQLLDLVYPTTQIYGDANQSTRVQSGTRSSLGGIQSKDIIPDYPSDAPVDRANIPPKSDLFPLKLWQGTMTDGVDALVISPSIWESDGNMTLFNRWVQNQINLNETLITAKPVQDQLKGKQFSYFKLGNVSEGTTNISTNGWETAGILALDAIFAIPSVDLPVNTAKDRPIGLAPNDMNSSALPNTTVVLTREIIEAALNGPSTTVYPYFVPNVMVTPQMITVPKPGIMVIVFTDTASVTGNVPILLGDGPATYAMILQVERM